MGPENIWLIALGGLAALVSNICYMIGGTDMGKGGPKWVRRYLGSFILALACNLIAVYIQAWQWPFLLVWPFLIGGMSLGYGADTLAQKILKRSIFALGVIASVLIGVWCADFSVSGWIVFGASALCGIVSVLLGAWNPLKNAPLEQFLVSQCLTLFVPFLAFINH